MMTAYSPHFCEEYIVFLPQMLAGGEDE